MSAGSDKTAGGASSASEAERRQWVTGMRIFMAVGIVFAVGYAVLADGPWRWLAGAIAMVSLVRGMWYGVKAREMSRAMEAEGETRGRP